MPSGTDFFNQLVESNNRLNHIIQNTDELEGLLTQVVDGQAFANTALVQQIRQNETIICLLKQIATNTCTLVNESHTQTGLQTGMSTDTRALADLFAITHADAALIREREQALKDQIEACCPPKQDPPACQPEKCAEPARFADPGPVLERRPRRKR
jgi:hypothetical protein